MCKVRLLITLIVLALGAEAAFALNCQYQGRPDSVVRSQPGFGVTFGTFQLIRSPIECPDDALAIQFSGVAPGDNAPIFISAIETCLNMAALLVVKRGFLTIELQDPLTGEPGVVIGNFETNVINTCGISRRR